MKNYKNVAPRSMSRSKDFTAQGQAILEEELQVQQNHRTIYNDLDVIKEEFEKGRKLKVDESLRAESASIANALSSITKRFEAKVIEIAEKDEFIRILKSEHSKQVSCLESKIREKEAASKDLQLHVDSINSKLEWHRTNRQNIEAELRDKTVKLHMLSTQNESLRKTSTHTQEKLRQEKSKRQEIDDDLSEAQDKIDDLRSQRQELKRKIETLERDNRELNATNRQLLVCQPGKKKNMLSGTVVFCPCLHQTHKMRALNLLTTLRDDIASTGDNVRVLQQEAHRTQARDGIVVIVSHDRSIPTLKQNITRLDKGVPFLVIMIQDDQTPDQTEDAVSLSDMPVNCVDVMTAYIDQDNKLCATDRRKSFPQCFRDVVQKHEENMCVRKVTCWRNIPMSPWIILSLFGIISAIIWRILHSR